MWAARVAPVPAGKLGHLSLLVVTENAAGGGDSVFVGVYGCGYHISLGVVLIGYASCPLLKMFPNYAYASYTITLFIVFDNVYTDPFVSIYVLKLWESIEK